MSKQHRKPVYENGVRIGTRVTRTKFYPVKETPVESTPVIPAYTPTSPEVGLLAIAAVVIVAALITIYPWEALSIAVLSLLGYGIVAAYKQGVFEDGPGTKLAKECMQLRKKNKNLTWDDFIETKSLD